MRAEENQEMAMFSVFNGIVLNPPQKQSSLHCSWSDLLSVLLDLLLLGTDGTVVLGEVVAELLVRRLGEEGLLPQVGGQVGVGLGNGGVSGLGWKKNVWLKSLS